MTKKPSQPDSKSTSPTGDDKAEAREVTGPEAMKRFKALAKTVIRTSPKAVQTPKSTIRSTGVRKKKSGA